MEMMFGNNYLVKREKEHFFAVYDINCTPKKLITHKKNWRQATKLAKLLEQAFKDGFNDARDLYDENPYR
jgi:hypothetical protein